MTINRRDLAEVVEARGEDSSDLNFLEMFYSVPAMRQEIGAPAECRDIATLDEFATQYLMASPKCYLTYVDETSGVRYFTLKNREAMTLGPALHSLWVETMPE